MKYLDPKADLTFKKVFGTHPRLVISLLNALLPLGKGEEVADVEYLTPEMVPDTPTKKYSIVDVRCTDKRGRQFIVEMQMIWSTEYKRRMVFNAAKAYVGQLQKAEDYKLLQPVYSLNLINDIFEEDIPDWYHHYQLVHNRYNNKVIEGLQLVLVELPKFTPHTMTEKKTAALWLRFLTEIDERTREVPQDLLDNDDVKDAIEMIEESAYTDGEMLAYDNFWDAIRVEKARANEAETRYNIGLEKGREEGREEGEAIGLKKGEAIGLEKGEAIGLEKGRAIGLEKGEAIGLEKGKAIGVLKVAKNMLANGMAADLIMQATGLSKEEIDKLL